MQSFLLVFHVLVAVCLIGLILVQHGKGADAGAAFGSGASATVFGARGSASFLTRATAVLAVLFFSNSFFLEYVAISTPEQKSLMERAQPVAPAGSDAAKGDVDVLETKIEPIPKEEGAPTVDDKASQTDLPAVPGASATPGRDDKPPVPEAKSGTETMPSVPPAPATDPTKADPKDAAPESQPSEPVAPSSSKDAPAATVPTVEVKPATPPKASKSESQPRDVVTSSPSKDTPTAEPKVEVKPTTPPKATKSESTKAKQRKEQERKKTQSEQRTGGAP
jgi:preprotein translocase subunit SecG